MGKRLGAVATRRSPGAVVSSRDVWAEMDGKVAQARDGAALHQQRHREAPVQAAAAEASRPYDNHAS